MEERIKFEQFSSDELWTLWRLLRSAQDEYNGLSIKIKRVTELKQRTISSLRVEIQDELEARGEWDA